MKNFFEKNKLPVTITVAVFIIAASIWRTKMPAPLQLFNFAQRPP
jgi:hypothetical protein